METYLKIKDASEALGVHRDTLRNWERRGLISPRRIGPRGDRQYSITELRKVASDLKEKDVTDKKPEFKREGYHCVRCCRDWKKKQLVPLERIGGVMSQGCPKCLSDENVIRIA